MTEFETTEVNLSDKSVTPTFDDDKKTGPVKKRVGILFLTVFLDLLGFGLIIPVMPSYALELHASDLAVGMLIASYSLMQLLFAPFWGRLSDHVGRRPILLMSLAASTVGYIVWGLSGSLAMLFISRLIQGAGNANIPVAAAYVADITTAENRAKGMGLIGAAFGLGFVFGPAIGGYCVSSVCQNAIANFFPGLLPPGHLAGLQMIGYVAAAITLLDFVLVYFLLPEPEKRSRAASERFSLDPAFYFETLNNSKLKVSLLIFFLSTFAFANMEATIILFTQRVFNFTPFENSMMFTYIGLLIVFVQGGMIHRLAKKYGEKHLIGIGTVLVGLGLMLIPFSPSSHNLVVLAIALALLSFGSGINNPSNQSLLSKLAPQEKMGGILGVGQSLSTLGRILGPIIGAAAFQYLGYASPYFIGAAVMMVAFVSSFALPSVYKASV